MTEKRHYRLSPSAAHRWMECPGEPAARLSAPKAPSSVWADEGTTAHWVAEQCLRGPAKTPDQFIGQVCPESGRVVTADMVEPLTIYVEECQNLKGLADYYGVETEFTLPLIHKDLGGTCDFWAYHRDVRTLYVRDYKHGQGKVVDVENNPQLLIYALGAALELCKLLRNHVIEDVIDDVDVAIVQPRAGGAPIRYFRITGQELAQWAYGPLLHKAKATDDPSAPRHAGPWCQFCPAKHTCPAIAEKAYQVARLDFGSPIALPDPAQLSIDRLAEIADAAELISDWAENAKRMLFKRLSNGETHPGWKLVHGRDGDRKWTPDGEAKLIATLGEKAYAKKLISPAQADKIFREHGLGGTPSDWTVRTPGGLALARAESKKPAYVPVLSEFSEVSVSEPIPISPSAGAKP